MSVYYSEYNIILKMLFIFMHMYTFNSQENAYINIRLQFLTAQYFFFFFALCKYKQGIKNYCLCINDCMYIIQTVNPFTPDILKWMLPSLNLDMSTDANWDFSLISKTKWQTVKILMRQLVTSCLIRIYTVCTGISFVCQAERAKHKLWRVSPVWGSL